MMGRLHNIIVIAAFAVVAAVPSGFGPFPGPMPGPGPGPFPSPVSGPGQFPGPDTDRIVNAPIRHVEIVPGISDGHIPRPRPVSGSPTSPTQSGFHPVTQRPGGELVRPTTPGTQPGSVQKDVSCGLNPSPGECQAAFPRYYYNSTTSQCDCYLFGGCDEEEGSYRSLKECHRRCLPNLKEEGPTCRLVYIDNFSPFSPPTTTSSPAANYPTENNRPATTRLPPTPLGWPVFPEGGRPSSGGPSSVPQPTTFQPTGNRPSPNTLFPSESTVSPIGDRRPTTVKPTQNSPIPTSSFGDRRPTTVKTTVNRPTPIPLFPAENPRVPQDPHVAFPDDGRYSSDSDYKSYYDY